MNSSPQKVSKNDTKIIDYKQDDKTYIIEIGINLDNAQFCIKNKNKIESYYDMEISFEEIQNKNPFFKVYQTIQDFVNSIEDLIKNKNISIQETEENLTLNITVFNMLNGNKENVSFVFDKKQNNDKDEIIKYLCKKVADLETKLNEMSKNYLNLKEVVDNMAKNSSFTTFNYTWENHSNCEIFDNGKRIKKVKNQGWNTGIRATNLLKKNEITIFKIKVNHIHDDSSGLQFGIAKYNSNISQYGTDWLMSCNNTGLYKYKNFIRERIDVGDIVTFIADLKIGTLEVLKNNKSLGKLNDIPRNEDLVPCASIYFVDDEIEIIN